MQVNHHAWIEVGTGNPIDLRAALNKELPNDGRVFVTDIETHTVIDSLDGIVGLRRIKIEWTTHED